MLGFDYSKEVGDKIYFNAVYKCNTSLVFHECDFICESKKTIVRNAASIKIQTFVCENYLRIIKLNCVSIVNQVAEKLISDME